LLLFDVIFCDVAGSSEHDGLSCPLPSFVTDDTLVAMRSALRERGVLVLNLVSRNEELAEQIRTRISTFFQHYFVHCSEEDLNEVLICPKIRKSLSEARKACEHLENEKGSLGNLFSCVSSLTVHKEWEG
uniref:STAS domain-containing protein n=1 Tax=Gongylonema pulchrum TaxID=637853 RepID=A0A183DRW9_9BILA